MGVSVAAVQGIASQFEKAHREEPVEILLPPWEAPDCHRDRHHVAHIDSDPLPPVREAGDLRPLADLVHQTADEKIDYDVGGPLTIREPEDFAKAVGRHKMAKLTKGGQHSQNIMPASRRRPMEPIRPLR